MRVVSGEYKNLKLYEPKNYKIRPTMDRSKEAIFNIIQFDIEGAKFLDLFAGSGAIGIEALSRGAQLVKVVDNSHEAINIIKKNNQLVDNQLLVVKKDVELFLEQEHESYNFIFLDPPYDIAQEKLISIIDKIKQNDLLQPGGEIILELGSERDFSHELVFDQRRYGRSCFYRMELT